MVTVERLVVTVERLVVTVERLVGSKSCEGRSQKVRPTLVLPPFAYLASQSTYIIPPSVERSLPTSHYDPSRPLRAITTHHITSYTPLWALTPNQRSSQCHQLATRSPDQPTNKNTQLTLRTHRPSHRQESTGARHKSWNPHTSKLNRHRHSRERCRSGTK